MDESQGRLPAPATPAAAERPLSSPHRAEQAVQNRSIGTLAGRAQARYRLASVQCTKSAPGDVLLRHFIRASGVVARTFTGPGSRFRQPIRRIRQSLRAASGGRLHGPEMCTSNGSRGMISIMTNDQVKEVLDRVLTWPPERQQDAAQMLLALEAHEGELYHPSDDEWAAIEEGFAQAKRGEIVSADEIAALLKPRGS